MSILYTKSRETQGTEDRYERQNMEASETEQILKNSLSGKIGRPTKRESERRNKQLLSAALDLFLEKGFERTSLDSIASSVNMTKRTIYSKYEDKEGFFQAVVRHAIERVVAYQARELVSCEAGTLEVTLTRVARMRLNQMRRPEGLQLLRIINAESYRFPEIFELSTNHVTAPVIEFVSRVLKNKIKEGIIQDTDPKLAATAFMSMVAGGPIRAMGASNPIDQSGIEDRIAFCVELFLNGLRIR